MPTNFPGSVDTYTLKVDNVSDVLAADVNNLQDAVVAIQNRVGTTAAPTFVTLTGNQVIAGDKRFSSSVRVGPNDTTALYYDAGLTVRTGAAGTQRFYVFNDNGDFYVNNGNIAASGNITANSDERLKHNWRDLDADFLTRLADMKMGVYDRIDSGQTQVGVSAQSLQNFLPQAVQVADNGTLSVAYGNAALVSCVMLAREVRALRAELNEMKGA